MMAAALRVPAARPSSGSVGGVGTVPGQGHSRRQSGGGCPHLPQHPSWLGVRVPLEPSLSPGATLQGGLCPLLRASGREPGRPRRWQASGEPERGADGGCDRGADGSPPPGGRCAERRGRCFQGRREPGAGSEGQLRPGCTAWWQVHSGCFSSQRQLEPPEGHPVPVCGWASAPCSELASVSVQAPVALSPALPCDVAHEGQRLPHRPAGTAMSCPSWACPRAGGAAPLGAARSSESLQPRGSRQA